MAAKGGHIDFMFLGPHYPAAGSDAVLNINLCICTIIIHVKLQFNKQIKFQVWNQCCGMYKTGASLAARLNLRTMQTYWHMLMFTQLKKLAVKALHESKLKESIPSLKFYQNK